MYSIAGTQPTFMYYQSLKHLLEHGEEVKPRGKLIKEVRPAALEFNNPYNRVTFLGNRRINPFFQIAESLWILSGRSDVEWLTKFNSNMAQFSDDGKYFNAPYGERMRSWNKNSLKGFIFNPIDQLTDVYVKLLDDKDTRQAVIVLYNPMFDNANYTVKEHGKDISCLSGDTIISSPEKDITLKELVEIVQRGEHYPVYSYNLETNTVEIQPVLDGALTRKNAFLLEITMGDGTVIKATPDHKFYRKKYATKIETSENGHKYKTSSFVGYELVQASSLFVGDRLGFLRIDTEPNGHMNINCHNLSKSVEKTKKVYRMYMEYLLGRPLEPDEVVHHINSNPRDNRAVNLQVLLRKEHDALGKTGNKFPLGTKKNWADPSELTKEHMLEVGCELVSRGGVLTENTVGQLFSGVGYLSAAQKNFGSFGAYKKAVYSEVGVNVPNALSGSKGNYNATKIVSIKFLEQTEDVYDITVANNHNFFANNYLVHNCNLILTFKIRQDKLHLTVFNRSNDLHWGTFGANLCQFSTIQEVLLNWLKHSGKEGYENLEVGTYTQITDSLHVYLDDYGAQITGHIEEYYEDKDDDEARVYYTTKSEPRMSLNAEQFSAFLSTYWGVIDPYLMDDEFIVSNQSSEVFGKDGLVEDLHSKGVIDDYWYFAIQSMLAYRLNKLGHTYECLETLSSACDCQWKISMLHFLKPYIAKLAGTTQYQSCANNYQSQVYSVVDSLNLSSEENSVIEYLKMF